MACEFHRKRRQYERERIRDLHYFGATSGNHKQHLHRHSSLLFAGSLLLARTYVDVRVVSLKPCMEILAIVHALVTQLQVQKSLLLALCQDLASRLRLTHTCSRRSIISIGFVA
jgi:hypothetical protein